MTPNPAPPPSELTNALADYLCAYFGSSKCDAAAAYVLTKLAEHHAPALRSWLLAIEAREPLVGNAEWAKHSIGGDYIHFNGRSYWPEEAVAYARIAAHLEQRGKGTG